MKLDAGPWTVGLLVLGMVLVVSGFWVAAGSPLGRIVGEQNPNVPTCGATGCTILPVFSVSPVVVNSVGLEASFSAQLYIFPSTNHLSDLQLEISGEPAIRVPVPPVATGLIDIRNINVNFSGTGIHSVYAAGNSTYPSVTGSTATLSQIGPVTSFSIVSGGSGGGGGNTCSASGGCPYVTPQFTYTVSGTGNLTVSFNDTSALHNSTFVTQDWSFGDGSTIVSGFEVRHVYNSPGVYAVTLEEVTTPTLPNGTQGTNVQDSVTMNVTVGNASSGGGGGGGGTGAGAPPGPALTFTPLSVALIVSGIVMVLLEFVPFVSGRWYVVLPAAGLIGAIILMVA